MRYVIMFELHVLQRISHFNLLWCLRCFTDNKYETNKISTTDPYDYQIYGM